MEENNKKTKTILIIVICILAVVAILAVGYIVVKELQNKNEQHEDNNNVSTSVVGKYEAKFDADEDGYVPVAGLVLRKDGTYVFASPGHVAEEYVGTYTVSNNVITFNEKVYYAHEGCYDTNESLLQKYVTTIDKDGGFTLEIPKYSDYGKMIFSKVGETDGYEDYILDPTKDENWESCNIDSSKEWKSAEYVSEFKEDKTTILDYDMKTNIENFNYKSAYDLVVKESSKLKKSKDINLFDYVGRVNNVGDYYYVNYDVYFYNLPKTEYDKVKDQLLEDKVEKVGSCGYNKCQMKITKGYESISKYLVKKAYYYYIFDGKNKVETGSIMSQSFVTSNIPDEWLKLGNYKTKEAMYKDVLLMNDESHTYSNYLVVYDTGRDIKLKYKGKTKSLADSSNYSEEVTKLYETSTKIDYFTTISKNVTINKKDVTLGLKFYLLKEYNKEIKEYYQNLYYDVFFNDKKVTNAEKKQVYYDECDGDDCSVSEKRLASEVTGLIKDVKVIVDNNKKEYAILDVFGYSPVGGEEIFVINNDGKLLLDMDASVNYGFGSFTGDGSGTYVYKDNYESFHLWDIKNDKIYYLEFEDEDNCEKVRFNEHVITINNGKISDKKTNNKFTGNSISGGCPSKFNVKAY